MKSIFKNIVNGFINEIAKHHEIPEKPTASGGPGYGWQVYI